MPKSPNKPKRGRGRKTLRKAIHDCDLKAAQQALERGGKHKSCFPETRRDRTLCRFDQNKLEYLDMHCIRLATLLCFWGIFDRHLNTSNIMTHRNRLHFTAEDAANWLLVIVDNADRVKARLKQDEHSRASLLLEYMIPDLADIVEQYITPSVTATIKTLGIMDLYLNGNLTTKASGTKPHGN